MLYLKKSFIGYILLTFILLEHLGLAIGSLFIPFFFIFEIIFLISMIIFYKPFFNNLRILFRYTPFHYLILFYIFAIITILISMVQRTFYLKSFLFSFIGGLNFAVIFVFITCYLLFCNFLPKSKFVKYYCIFCIFVFSLGLLEFVLQKISGGIPGYIYHLFNNERAILGYEVKEATSLFISERIQSIFSEPSSLGEFIYLNAPIIYSISLSKFKIFKNIKIDKILKIFLLFSMIVCFILVQSPITFLFFIIISLIFFLKNIFIGIKKNIILFLSLTLFIIPTICILFFNLDINQTYLKRIIVSLPTLFSLETLILVEASLATRIIDNINALLIFLKFPLFGIGYGNITGYIFIQLANTPLPLTKELLYVLLSGTGAPPYGLFYRVLAETGIMGIGLLYYYFIQILICVKKKIKYSNNGIEKDFVKGIGWTILFYITLSAFYNSSLHKTMIFMLCAYAVYFCFNRDKIIYTEGNKDGCIDNISKL